MLDKNTLKKIIIENSEFAENAMLIKRPLTIEKNGNYVFLGPRRAGKSYTMLRLIQEILEGGGTSKDYLYIRFEDERLIELGADDLDNLLEAHGELYGAGKPVLFLDEIQDVPGWEKYVRRLSDNKYRVFVTGSNSGMIGREIASTLGGRFLIREIYPYAFQEYLNAKNADIDVNWKYGKRRIDIARHFEEWFRWGGFPEILSNGDKRFWLENLYQKIFFGDICTRYAIRNSIALRLLVKKLAECVQTEMSINRMKNIISGAGVNIGKSTIIEYLSYLEESYVIFIAENQLSRFSEREQSKKYFFVDNGILSLFIMDADAKLLENLVAGEIVRRGYRLRYAKDNEEIDFYIKEEDVAIQVVYSLKAPEVEKREVASMLKVNKKLGAKRLLFLTAEEDRIIEQDRNTIQVVSIQNWVLDSFL